MGLSTKDIRVFYDSKSRSWIIANDYKKRRLMSQGFSVTESEKNSHGHIKNKKIADKIKVNILSNRKTKSREIRTLMCYIRVCDDSYKHYNWVRGLYETKKNKGKQKFVRIQRECVSLVRQ